MTYDEFQSTEDDLLDALRQGEIDITQFENEMENLIELWADVGGEE